MPASFLYRFLKLYCKIGLWFYFKEWKVKDKNIIIKNRPTIFIANHQNAFLDAILMTCSTQLNPFFLARANVFEKSWAATLLSLIRIKPVFRFRDGFSTIKNNEVIFQECVDLLKKGETILLFPEANHNEPYTTRAYQKGFARIALLYAKQTGKLDVAIQPTSIYYTQHHTFQGSVLLHNLSTIQLDHVPSNAAEEKLFYEKLTQQAYQQINHHLPILAEDSTYKVKLNLLINSRSIHQNVEKICQNDKENIENDVFAKNNFHSISKLFLKNLIDFLWKLYHCLPWYFTRWVIKNKIKDNQFISSIQFAIGIFFVPGWYLLLMVMLHFANQHFMWMISVPFVGMILTILRKFTR